MPSSPFFVSEPIGDAVGQCLFLHGAGAPADSEFMSLFTACLIQHQLRVVRYECEYMRQRRETGKKRPPPRMPDLVNELKQVLTVHNSLFSSPLPMCLIGKSMGARIASHLLEEKSICAQFAVALGYPFHPIGKPDSLRIAHFEKMRKTLWVYQGTRDSFGKPHEVTSYPLSPQVQINWLEDADHDFCVLKKSKLTQSDFFEYVAQNIQSKLIELR